MSTTDPTQDTKLIKGNPSWELAFWMSEIDNHEAPIGWGKYIHLADSLLDRYEIHRKER